MVSYATDAFRIQNAHVAPISLDSFIYSNAIQTGSGGRATDPDHFNRSSVISLRDGYFRYEKDADWVLRGCDIEISPASIHAIIGGNGSGKSTILQLITGVLKPQRGRVENDFREAQAYLAQDPKALFVCDSIEEELGEWQDRCGYSASDIAETAQRFGLDRLLSRHPYDLSGGQQQKLAMAKLLLTEPRLLLLDEPTKGLDAESKCELVQTLLDLRTAGTTIVLVTHDLGFVRRVADRVTMLFDGQAACSEPVEDFFAHNIFYRPHTDAFSHRCNTCAGHRPDGRVCEISQQDRCVEPSSSVTSLRSTY
ncbi:MAG: energy-coupling factor ABC transporter ATP-binding protein [Coriobacteriia bacterium]|nr:energy-coupling factor ABC transporter ATP-binding protein [Coriobacteriia bacterium]